MKSPEYQEPRVQFTEGTGQNLVKPDLRVKENKYFDSFFNANEKYYGQK